MMPYGRVEGVDKPVSRLVLGTMILHTDRLEESFALLDAAMELGYNTLDCAHVYGGGGSERAIGRWMQARGNREQVVILTKGCHPNADRKRVTPFDLAADLHDSLARLQTDYIDLYLLHRDDPEVPVGPIVEALNHHHREGKIRAFGGSNWRHERIQQANEYARAHGLLPFAASSPHFSLAEQVQDPWGPGCVALSGPREAAARAWYAANQMPIFALFQPGPGLLLGADHPGELPGPPGHPGSSLSPGLLPRGQFSAAGPGPDPGPGETGDGGPDRPGLRAQPTPQPVRPGGRRESGGSPGQCGSRRPEAHPRRIGLAGPPPGAPLRVFCRFRQLVVQ